MLIAVALVVLTAALVGGAVLVINRFNTLFNDETMTKLDEWSAWMKESAGYSEK